MHLLLIHQAFVSPSEAGGTRHFEFARHCVQAGHQVTIVASDLSYLSGQKVGESKGLITEQMLDGVRVLRAYTYPSLHHSLWGRLMAVMSFMLTSLIASMKAGRVDIIIGTSPPIFQAVSAWIVAGMRRKVFLLEVRDLWTDFVVDMGAMKNRLLIFFCHSLEAFLYRRAKYIVVNSPAYRDHLVEQGVEASKIGVIPNGVDSNLFDPSADGEHIRREFGLEGKFVVTYAGALGKTNDVQTILRAADRVRDETTIRFLLVGDGVERGTLEGIKQKLNLDNVIFTGARPKSEIPGFLAASDACVATLMNITMFKKPYPNKVFDYMAAGRPTLLAIDGVIRTVIEAAHGGVFIPPGDDLALAMAVKNLSANGPAAQEMGREARDYVVRHFDRRQQADQFLRLLTALIDGKQRYY